MQAEPSRRVSQPPLQPKSPMPTPMYMYSVIVMTGAKTNNLGRLYHSIDLVVAIKPHISFESMTFLILAM